MRRRTMQYRLTIDGRPAMGAVLTDEDAVIRAAGIWKRMDGDGCVVGIEQRRICDDGTVPFMAYWCAYTGD